MNPKKFEALLYHCTAQAEALKKYIAYYSTLVEKALLLTQHSDVPAEEVNKTFEKLDEVTIEIDKLMIGINTVYYQLFIQDGYYSNYVEAHPSHQY